MESFVFNSFKEKLINGTAKLNDTWHHYPVNKKFTEAYEDKIQSFRTSGDFIMYDMANNPENAKSYWKHMDHYQGRDERFFNSWYDFYGTKIKTIDYTYMPMVDVDTPMHPEFVTEDKWDFFSDADKCKYLYELFFYEDDVKETPGVFFRESGFYDEAGKPIPRGFYYVKTKEELLWCSQKVNNSIYDNTINIVLGDNIGGFVSVDKNNEEENNYTKINFTIGSNPAQPFEGIFFGNGFGFKYVELICNNTANGIVGYLGNNGLISHVWVDNCKIICNKSLSLTHLTTDGTDIVAGFICGNNYGKIQNINITNTVSIAGFIPKMYSIKNKTDDTEDKANVSPDTNVFYPDYLCYNSLGNIIPYIGYFNEGVFATYSGYCNYNDRVHFYTYWNTALWDTGYDIKQPQRTKTPSPAEWYYWNGLYDNNLGGYLFSFTPPIHKKNILWYDASIVETVYNTVDPEANSIGIKDGKAYGLLYYTPKTSGDFYQSFIDVDKARYFNRSIKMNQQNRAAYYVSPCVGMNAGILKDVYISANMEFSGTFVGFAGGIAGKQSKGIINDCSVTVSASDYITTDKDNKPVIPRNELITYDYAPDSPNAVMNYQFKKKSILNIGGLFGSLVVGNSRSLALNAVSGSFDNRINIIGDNTGIIHNDYYFANRFGGIAAVVEYNSCNISDIWYWNSKIAEKFSDPSEYAPLLDINGIYANNDVNGESHENRSISITDCVFNYTEEIDTALLNGGYSVSRVIDLHKNSATQLYSNFYDFGVSSPMFAEVKPVYLSVPSIIASPFHNTEVDLENEDNYVTGLDGVKRHSSWDRLGLFMMDQMLAAPLSDPDYWSVNMELDLPGVSNGLGLFDVTQNKGWKYSGYAGGVIDLINAREGTNFTMDTAKIPGKIINWKNTVMYNNTHGDYVWSSITLPAAASIYGVRTEDKPSAGRYDTDFRKDFRPHLQGYLEEKNTQVIPDEENSYYYIYERNASLGNSVGNGREPMDYIAAQWSEAKYSAPDIDTSTAASADSTYAVGYTKSGYRDFKNFIYNGNKIDLLYPYFGSDLIIEPNEITNDETFERDTIDLTKLDFDYIEIVYENAPHYLERQLGGDRDGGNAARPGVYSVKFQIRKDAFSKAPFTTIPTNIGEIDENYIVTVKSDARFSTDDGDIGPNNYVNTRIWRRTYDNNEGTYGNGISELSAFYDNQDVDQRPFRKWRDSKAFGAGYGWYFYSDDDEGRSKDEFANAVILFDFSPYNRNRKDGISPPNFPFCLGYVCGQKTHRDGGASYDDDSHDWYDDNLDPAPLTNCVSIKYFKHNTETGDDDDVTENIKRVIENDRTTGTYNIVPKPFYALNKVGKFHNDLINCSINMTDEMRQNDVTFKYELLDIGHDKDAWYNTSVVAANKYFKKIVDEAMEEIPDEENYATYFKYTYTKHILSKAEENPISGGVWNCGFDYQNNKAGFWFRNEDAKYQNVEYNDNFRYSENLLTFGKTLNEQCILAKLESDKEYQKNGITLSSISADDFEGLYITDSNNEPVMYIDVGMGECTDGTSWTYKCYPSVPESEFEKYTENDGFLPPLSGLLLEVNTDV